MKHSKVIAAIATTGSLFVMNSAHAIVPVVAAAIGAMAGAAVGTAATQNNPPPVAVVQQPPTVAVVPDNSTVVMGAPAATVTEVIPAPREGYRWDRGHYEIRDGVTAWVPGHWIAL